MSVLTDTFTAIANAIRTKGGTSTTYKPAQMAGAIRSIPNPLTSFYFFSVRLSTSTGTMACYVISPSNYNILINSNASSQVVSIPAIVFIRSVVSLVSGDPEVGTPQISAGTMYYRTLTKGRRWYIYSNITTQSGELTLSDIKYVSDINSFSWS